MGTSAADGPRAGMGSGVETTAARGVGPGMRMGMVMGMGLGGIIEVSRVVVGRGRGRGAGGRGRVCVKHHPKKAVTRLCSEFIYGISKVDIVFQVLRMRQFLLTPTRARR